MNFPVLGWTPDPMGNGPLRRYIVGAALACLLGVVLVGSDGLRPLGLLLCSGAAIAFLWMAWRIGYWREEAVASVPVQAFEPAPEQFGPLLEALPDPALLIDAQGRVAGANAAARRMMGFATSGLRLASVLRRPELLDAAESAARDGAAVAVDYDIAAPVEEHFRVFVAQVHLERGNAALMVFHDQTSAINTDRMRADFLANASHELRTPLASLTLLIETLAGHAKNDPAAHEKFLGMMKSQAVRMRELLDDLLSLSKIELNEHVPPSDEVELAALAQAMVEKLSPQAQKRGVSVMLAPGSQPVTVVGDRSQLSQVAQNLIDNAIKYSSRGSNVEIEIGAGEDREEAARRAGRRWETASRISLLSPAPDATKHYGYLRVSDAGPGIDRRYLPRLSERFYRVERDETSDQSGTGLGLAIVKHIVNRHRGGFIVESEKGRGSAFAIYLERPAAAPVAIQGVPANVVASS